MACDTSVKCNLLVELYGAANHVTIGQMLWWNFYEKLQEIMISKNSEFHRMVDTGPTQINNVKTKASFESILLIIITINST